MTLASCYAKLTISDLLNLPLHSADNTELLRYKDHLISRVEIVGTITGIRCYPERYIYEVDDGTGTLPCILYHQSDYPGRSGTAMEIDDPSVASCSSRGQAVSALTTNPTLDDILQLARQSDSSPSDADPPNMGELVLIHGRLKHFQDMRKVYINFMKVLNDPNWETFHLIQQVDLYRRMYDVHV